MLHFFYVKSFFNILFIVMLCTDNYIHFALFLTNHDEQQNGKIYSNLKSEFKFNFRDIHQVLHTKIKVTMSTVGSNVVHSHSFQ